MKFLLLLLLLSANAFAVGKIQNEDVKSRAQLESAGSTQAHLPNAMKIWSQAITKQLDTAIADGTVCTNCSLAPVTNLVGLVIITGCASDFETISHTYADFPVQTGCIYTLVSGSSTPSAPSTMIPAIKFASLPAGEYSIEYEGVFLDEANVSTPGGAYFQFWDGTNTAREQSVALSSATKSTWFPHIKQSIRYASTQTNITLSIRSKEPNGSAGDVISELFCTTGFPCVIRIYKM